ncbi:MAG: zinc ribbon domain-containing protein [Halobacteriales archaeon]|nr:zinc ribbon domain-containing protein [Halobacteriales archaeon]
MSRRRALIAGAFAVVYPGLGHVYLREWLRALSWFGLALLTAALVVPADVVTAYETGGLSGLAAASQNLPTAALVALLLVRLLNIIDAVRLALVPPRAAASSDVATCPECGSEVDPQLDFCHWCTARLDEPNGAGAATQGEGLFR